MLRKSASKAFKKVEPLRSSEKPTETVATADVDAAPVYFEGHGTMDENVTHASSQQAPPKKMLKKSASKAFVKLEPLRSVDSVRPPPRKSTNEIITNSAVTSITEVSDTVLQELDDLVKYFNSEEHSSLSAHIIQLCKDLRMYGHILERKDSMQMDRYFVFLRDAAQDQRIDQLSRLRLLQIIELRASGWKNGDGLFYKSKLIELENSDAASNNSDVPPALSSSPVPSSLFLSHEMGSSNANNNVLSPGEVLKSSGKYGKPSKISSKNYYKDEIVIHNADSGKVMGIKGRRVHMIEELSGTIVSFQRVLPGAKDRLVQITGPTEATVAYAQQLIEETIVRNTSPIRDRPNPLQTSESASNVRKVTSSMENSFRPPISHSMSMNDASLGEYQYTVYVGQDLIKLAGSKLDVIRTAKLVLEEYFAGDAKRTSHEMTLEEMLTPSDDEILSSSPSPTNFTRTPLTSSSSSCASWEKKNGGAPFSKAARITGRCISHESTVGSDDSDDEDEDFLQVKSNRSQYARDPDRRIVYRRNFLLTCSQNPYSKTTPKCLAKIIQENPNILKKTADFFDPEIHKSSVGQIEISSTRFWNQYSRGGSQEGDELNGTQ